jgi:3',5'-nucleoside bisphosphate phosphatase
MNIDLHTHTNASDGKLAPVELLQRAEAKGIELLSITDHDTVAAYSKIKRPLLTLIPGIEFSTFWNRTGIHIVGLNIDLQSNAITEAIAFQSTARHKRAEAIATNLESKGIKDAFTGAGKIAGNNNIGRPHFAEYLVQTGTCVSIEEAFKKYLGAGKSGDIKKFWATMPQIIDWIHAAGGIAVLAHPLTYKMTRSKLSLLLDDFIAAGGQGIEVVSGKQLPHETRDLARLCNQKKLMASCGSDFHQPGKSWIELGQFPPLPKDCDPVWEYF